MHKEKKEKFSELNLKKYKSCAGCYRFELSVHGSNEFCHYGFPLEELDKPIIRSDDFGYNDNLYYYKPKYGCLQKEYRGIKPQPEAARALADKMQV